MSSTTEFLITVKETNESGDTNSLCMGFAQFIQHLWESNIKPRRVTNDCKAVHRDMLDVKTADEDITITLEAPTQGKTITTYIIKSDSGKGKVIVSGQIEGKDFHTLEGENDKCKYTSINGDEYKKWY